MRNMIELTKCSINGNRIIQKQRVLINPDRITVISKSYGRYLYNNDEVGDMSQINLSGDSPIIVLEDLETIQKLLKSSRKLLE